MPEPFEPPKSKPVPESIRVDMPKEPPKEVLDKTFEMDPNLLAGKPEGTVVVEDKNASNLNAKTEAKAEDKPAIKEEEKKEVSPLLKPPVVEKKVEDKKEEKKGLIAPVKIPGKEDKIQRDYTGFTDKEIAAFKQMSDQSYQYVSELIKEKKQLEGLKDSTFLQHPDAYTLSPEFRQLQVESRQAQQEGDVWQNVLLKIRKGEKFKEPVGRDQNGNIIMSEYEVDPSDRVEELARANMNQCYQIGQQTQGKLQGVISNFQNRTKTDLQAIQQERASKFPWVADPKLLDYTLSIDGVGELSIKQIKQDFTNLFPPYYRNSPGVEVASDMLVALRMQHAELQQALAGKTTAEIKREEVQRGEPNSIVKPSPEPEVNGKLGQVKDFSTAGMPR